MPASMAACARRTAARSVGGNPRCQPPKPMMDTRSPVRPNGRVGISRDVFAIGFHHATGGRSGARPGPVSVIDFARVRLKVRCLIAGAVAAFGLSGYPSVARQTPLSSLDARIGASHLDPVDPAISRALGASGHGRHILRAVLWDFDRDGDLDVVASTVEEPVAVWINDGHGQYTRQQPISRPLVTARPGTVEPVSGADTRTAPPTRNQWTVLAPRQVFHVSDLPVGEAPVGVPGSERRAIATRRPARAPPVSSLVA